MREKCRIVVVGDEGVGKTSLIQTFISEAFPEKVKPVYTPVTVSPELTPDHVPLTIVDTPSRPDQHSKVVEELRKADVIVVVYAVERPESLPRVSQYWLRDVVRPLDLKVPVVLVGNKTDLRPQPDGTNTDLENEIMPIMNEFKEVETCIEVSAKAMLNVTEMFYFSLKAVIHPTPPLYDMQAHTIKPLCSKALKRIFLLLDQDQDGYLNDRELKAFQRRCFNVDLHDEELNGVKSVVQENCPEGIHASRGITLQGFLFLHTLFIERGRLETTWVVLRTFGYDDTLRLSKAAQSLKKYSDQALELNDAGRSFLQTLFERYARENNSALSRAEAEEMFSTTPSSEMSSQLSEIAFTNGAGMVTLEGFISVMKAFLLMDPKAALEQLAYFGYDADPVNLVSITKRRKIERKKSRLERDNLLCYVFGSKGCGKTGLMRALAGKEIPAPENVIPYTVRTFATKTEGTKTLVMREIPSGSVDAVLRPPQKDQKNQMEACDIACLLYDRTDPESFRFVAHVLSKIADPLLPCIFISTKGDVDPVMQRYEVTPEVFCSNLGIPSPICLSTRTKEKYGADGRVDELDVVFDMLASVALNPHLACREVSGGGSSSTGAIVGKAIGALLISGAVAYGVKVAWGIWSNRADPDKSDPATSDRK